MASPIPSNIPAKDPGNIPSSEKAAPSYTPCEVAQPYPSQPYPALPHFYVSLAQQQHQQPGHRKRSVIRRFFTAFAFAVTIWALMNALVHSIQVVTRFNATFDNWPEDKDFPIPPDLERVRCSWGDQAPDQIPLTASYKQILKAPLTFPFKREEKFELPIDSETLFFLSRGVYSGGQVKVVRSHKHSDVAKVKIRLEYLRPGGPRIAKVCQFTRGDGENGIGIFTPSEARYPRHHNLRFYVTIKLPKSSSNDDVLHIKNFETDLPNFTQVFRKVGKTVIFDDISVKGSNGGIIGGHLVAHQGSIESSNGPISIDLTSLGPFNITSCNGGIRGAFNVTRSLTLKTHNDKIKGFIALNPDKDGLGTLDLATENSLIGVDVALNPFQKDASGGQFRITSTASRTPTLLRVREAPINSTLLVNVSTTYSPAEVHLPSTFEGGFEVIADHFRPTVLASSHVRDPSGEGRKRDVIIEREGSRANGTVSWSEEGKERGCVELRTTYSPAVLKL